MATNEVLENESNNLIEVAMQIILHAGDARNLADEAFQIAKTGEFAKAHEKLKEANSAILEAHKAQTKVIQDETRGIKHEPSLLFNHAQDTLMTIISEIKITKKLVEVLELTK